MDNIFKNKFTDQVSMVQEYFLPEIESFHNENQGTISKNTLDIINSAKNYKSHNAFEKLMHEYDLSSNEGVVLMCLAEALLRIPDTQTINDLIEDKIPSGDWKDHIKNDNNLFVNFIPLVLYLSMATKIDFGNNKLKKTAEIPYELPIINIFFGFK